MINKNRLKKNGFTIIEALLAVTVVSIGIIGSYSVIAYNISNISNPANRTIAANMAQDGIELVRNIRDSNFLSGVSWDDNLVQTVGDINQTQFVCGGAYRRILTSSTAPSRVTDIGDCNTAGNPDCRLYMYEKGSNPGCISEDLGLGMPISIYGTNYNKTTSIINGAAFYRLITLNKLNPDSISVKVDIKWVERGRSHYFAAQEILYNWK